jgi:hypothetical protein
MNTTKIAAFCDFPEDETSFVVATLVLSVPVYRSHMNYSFRLNLVCGFTPAVTIERK